ncbi:MAG: Fic family protein [Terriglobales bacterium]
MNHDVVRKLIQNESALQNINSKLDLVLARTNALVSNLQQSPSSLLNQFEPIDYGETPTASLSVSMLCWLHRVVTEGTKTPESSRGRLRAVGVWLGPLGSTPDKATFIPPDDFVRPLLELLDWWKSGYADLRTREKRTVIGSLAQFHHRFLVLHPFLDANGRVARVLLDQAARELLNSGVGSEFVSDPAAYYRCLVAGDKGDLRPLIDLIEVSLR